MDRQDQAEREITSAFGEEIAVQSFPNRIFPSKIEDFLAGLADSVNSPVDYPSCYAIAIMSGLIGNCIQFEIKKDWQEPLSLFIGCVGRSSMAKSPPINIMMRSILNENLSRFAAREEKYAGRAEGQRVTYNDDEGTLVIDYTTTEALLQTNDESPRGLMLYAPELGLWRSSLGMYRSGKSSAFDIGTYIRCHDGNPIQINRKGATPIIIPRPHCSIVGSLQPDLLVDFLDDHHQGLASRFLLCFPKGKAPCGESFRTVSDDLMDGWVELVRSAISVRPADYIDVGAVSVRVPIIYRMNSEAMDAWVAHTWKIAGLMCDETPEQELDWLGKAKGCHAARLSCIIQLIWDLSSDLASHSHEVQADSVEKASRLCDYFFSHLKKIRLYCQGVAGRTTGGELMTDVRSLLDWISSAKTNVFTSQQAFSATRRKIQKIKRVQAAIEQLVLCGVLIQTEKTFRVNPRFYTSEGRRRAYGEMDT